MSAPGCYVCMSVRNIFCKCNRADRVHLKSIGIGKGERVDQPHCPQTWPRPGARLANNSQSTSTHSNVDLYASMLSKDISAICQNQNRSTNSSAVTDFTTELLWIQTITQIALVLGYTKTKHHQPQ